MVVLSLRQPVLEIAICGKTDIRVRWASLTQVGNLVMVSQRWGITNLGEIMTIQHTILCRDLIKNLKFD